MGHINNLAALRLPNITTIQASFSKGAIDGRVYTFKCNKALAAQLKPGDLVVADSAKGYSVVWVHSVDQTPQIDSEAPYPYRWAFQKVDIKALEICQVLEQAVAEVILIDIENNSNNGEEQ